MLSQYVPSMFSKSWISIKIKRWSFFAASSINSSDIPRFGDKIKTPFENLIVAKEYLEMYQNYLQWRNSFR
jgi:hypothetical protein